MKKNNMKNNMNVSDDVIQATDAIMAESEKVADEILDVLMRRDNSAENLVAITAGIAMVFAGVVTMAELKGFDVMHLFNKMLAIRMKLAREELLTELKTKVKNLSR